MGDSSLNMIAVNCKDVQGWAKHGYRCLVEAKYFLLTIRDRRAAVEWPGWRKVATAEELTASPPTALHIAFTYDGLRKMGLPESIADGFSIEFIQGMAEPSRSRRLGDICKSAPSRWCWGGGPDKMPHLIVMLFAKSDLASFESEICTEPWGEAFNLLKTLETSNMKEHEPFGFRDSISNPKFDWSRNEPIPKTAFDYRTTVALGELLLGYPNEYNKYTDRPLLNAADDPGNYLAPAEDDPEKKDLGRNGTYLVLRQLEQDVHGFWAYLNSAGSSDATERARLGAAMVGRTLEGVPIVKPNAPKLDNDFTYDADARGLRCPISAHIRRANPRNADFVGRPSGLISGLLSRLALPRPPMRSDLISSTRFHRLLRRGREYGKTLPPAEAVDREPPEGRPGLQFACLCANISRQFEFLQNAWLMSTKFNGLTEESDPLLGNRAAVGDGRDTGNFSMPRDGQLARRLGGMPQFVTVRGGAYFFLPSLSALRYIVNAARSPGTD